jgi:hypothetical protein
MNPFKHEHGIGIGMKPKEEEGRRKPGKHGK